MKSLITRDGRLRAARYTPPERIKAVSNLFKEVRKRWPAPEYRMYFMGDAHHQMAIIVSDAGRHYEHYYRPKHGRKFQPERGRD